MKRLLLVAFAVGCASAPAQKSSDDVQMKKQAIADLEEAREARVREAREQDEEVESTDGTMPPAELAVEMLQITPDAPVRSASGLEIQLEAMGPPWAFAFNHHGRKTVSETAISPLYAEGIAFGQLWVAEQSGKSVQLTLRSDVPSEPLSEKAAYEIARRERAKRVGCSGTSEKTEMRDNGTLALRVTDASGAEQCVVVVGRYTRAVVD